MDAPFPEGMLADIEKFFREVHPTLEPGKDMYDEVFATNHFFPLQRKRELTRMMQIARNVSPATVMEIGADKGGGLYHWCMCLPTVRNVIACEIRGTPYCDPFEAAFPNIDFLWLAESSQGDGGPRRTSTIDVVKMFLKQDSIPAPRKIDVLFIDGDKLGMLKDFEAYLPMVRQPGGVVFIHDVQDHEPYHQFQGIVKRGYRTETIIDKSEYFGLPFDFQPKTPWEGWLQHWRGRSCGVGVVYL